MFGQDCMSDLTSGGRAVLIGSYEVNGPIVFHVLKLSLNRYE